MNRYAKLLLMGSLSALLLVGCGAKEDTKISTIDDNSKEVVVVNINETEDNEHYEMLEKFYLSDKTDDFDFSTKLLSDEKSEIRIPVLVNFKGELSMDYINQLIRSHAEKLVSNTSDVADGVKLIYSSEVLAQNNNFISIKFTGDLPYEGSSYKFVSGLIIDLNSTNQISYDNLFTEDRSLLNEAFEKSAKENDTMSFLPADYMIMYIEDTNLVFSYMENDMATDFTEIKVPLKSILPNLNTDFGKMPSS